MPGGTFKHKHFSIFFSIHLIQSTLHSLHSQGWLSLEILPPFVIFVLAQGGLSGSRFLAFLPSSHFPSFAPTPASSQLSKNFQMTRPEVDLRKRRPTPLSGGGGGSSLAGWKPASSPPSQPNPQCLVGHSAGGLVAVNNLDLFSDQNISYWW